MTKRFAITLAGVTYDCRPFNIGELEDMAELIGKVPQNRVPFALLYMALTRAVAEPMTEEAIKAIVAPNGEVQVAMVTIMAANGIETKPGEPKPGTAAV